MPNKTAPQNGVRRHTPTCKKVGIKKSGRAERWKKVLERNLIREGISPTEAKELVDLAAS